MYLVKLDELLQQYVVLAAAMDRQVSALPSHHYTKALEVLQRSKEQFCVEYHHDTALQNMIQIKISDDVRLLDREAVIMRLEDILLDASRLESSIQSEQHHVAKHLDILKGLVGDYAIYLDIPNSSNLFVLTKIIAERHHELLAWMREQGMSLNLERDLKTVDHFLEKIVIINAVAYVVLSVTMSEQQALLLRLRWNAGTVLPRLGIFD